MTKQPTNGPKHIRSPSSDRDAHRDLLTAAPRLLFPGAEAPPPRPPASAPPGPLPAILLHLLRPRRSLLPCCPFLPRGTASECQAAAGRPELGFRPEIAAARAPVGSPASSLSSRSVVSCNFTALFNFRPIQFLRVCLVCKLDLLLLVLGLYCNICKFSKNICAILLCVPWFQLIYVCTHIFVLVDRIVYWVIPNRVLKNLVRFECWFGCCQRSLPLSCSNIVLLVQQYYVVLVTALLVIVRY